MQYLSTMSDLKDILTGGILTQTEFAVSLLALQSRYPNERRSRGGREVAVDDVTEEEPYGEGGGESVDKLKEKRRETQHKKDGDDWKGKKMTVEMCECPVSDTGDTAKKKRCGTGVGGVGTGGGSVKKCVHLKCPHNKQRSRCQFFFFIFCTFFKFVM